MRPELIIEDGWIKEDGGHSDLFLSIFNRNRKVAKIKNKIIAEELVELYNQKNRFR